MPEQPTVTGASSGVGLYASKALADRGWHVIMACRDLEKARRAVETHSINPERITLQHIDLGSQQSVRNFVKALGIVLVSVTRMHGRSVFREPHSRCSDTRHHGW